MVIFAVQLVTVTIYFRVSVGVFSLCYKMVASRPLAQPLVALFSPLLGGVRMDGLGRRLGGNVSIVNTTRCSLLVLCIDR